MGLHRGITKVHGRSRNAQAQDQSFTYFRKLNQSGSCRSCGSHGSLKCAFISLLPILWARASPSGPQHKLISPLSYISVQLRGVEPASVFDRHQPPQSHSSPPVDRPTMKPGHIHSDSTTLGRSTPGLYCHTENVVHAAEGKTFVGLLRGSFTERSPRSPWERDYLTRWLVNYAREKHRGIKRLRWT